MFGVGIARWDEYCGRIVLCALVALSAAGCGRLKYWDYHNAPLLPAVDNPLPTLHAISITPVIAPEAAADCDWSARLEEALLKVEGVTTVRRVEAASSAGAQEGLPRLENGSQALLQFKVLAFDPYYPPSARVEVDFFVPRYLKEEDGSVLDMDRHGSPPRAARESRREPWIRFQRVFDAQDPGVARSLSDFARRQGDWDRGLGDEDRVLRVSDRFVDFVCYETLKSCFARITTKEKESDGFLRKLLAGSAE